MVQTSDSIKKVSNLLPICGGEFVATLHSQEVVVRFSSLINDNSGGEAPPVDLKVNRGGLLVLTFSQRRIFIAFAIGFDFMNAVRLKFKSGILLLPPKENIAEFLTVLKVAGLTEAQYKKRRTTNLIEFQN